MDIPGLGRETAAALVARELVRQPADLYRLSSTQVRELPHFAARSAENLVRAIRASRSPPLDRFIYALGIPRVGMVNAQQLAHRFGTLEALRDAGTDELRSVSGLGDVLAVAVNSFFHDPSNRKAIDALLENGARPVEPGKVAKGPLMGKIFVFTGGLETLTRSDAQERIRDRGGRTAGRVSAQTDFLVVGENPGAKLAEARRRNVTTLSEKELLKLLNKGS
jgi:DNA ligase (NAD+)